VGVAPSALLAFPAGVLGTEEDRVCVITKVLWGCNLKGEDSE